MLSSCFGGRGSGNGSREKYGAVELADATNGGYSDHRDDDDIIINDHELNDHYNGDEDDSMTRRKGSLA